MTVYDYVLKADSLISFSYFLTLVKLAYPDVSDWNLVVTFSYPESPRDVSGIPNNPIYGTFISKEEKLIIDVYCETTNLFGGLQSFKDLMKMNIEQQKGIYDRNKKDTFDNMSQVVTLYTFDKEYLYNEFLESYMAGEKLQYELKHKINTKDKTKSKSKAKPKSKSNDISRLPDSSTSSLELDKEDIIDISSKSKVDENKNNQESNKSKLTKRNIKKRKEIKVEQIPLNPYENKKPDNIIVQKYKELSQKRYYRIIENTILFFIILAGVKYYSKILSFIYGKAFSLAGDALKLLRE
ncbi:hypothetical protein BCR32DRAFT_139016 [Anaeromyces robustus]|uniref:Uncharacterized protein n=1 Tax=Anaeromyces robustus TaxID=1754192 RepID=A0A1Y1VQH0_9FUNG|nr:hypothetical protein BCR32DRAFT_139016 [Anaeromyces robustus]|eukprot:ORX63558.1 hypothetical protein BCR32DRAFT_139016 [Anaeromyces robustus]